MSRVTLNRVLLAVMLCLLAWRSAFAQSADTLVATAYLYPGQSISSASGYYQLTYQTDGNLVVRQPTGPVAWSSNAHSDSPSYAAMQNDGNVVLYDASGTPYWSWFQASHTPTGAYYAQLQDDGNLVVHAPDGTIIGNTGVYVAQFTYPINGAAHADLGQPITWTTVPGAQAYYLYVGTTVGSNNLINTGEIHQTSYAVGNLLASNQTVYARIYTEVDYHWYASQDIAFTEAPRATFIAPANGTNTVDFTQPITWTSVSGAQAYYLKVGTAPGASNIINTGEIQQTSYSAATIPVSLTVYARISTEIAGAWSHQDITFSGALPATFTAPLDGTTIADLTQPITWTAVPNVQAYYLYVGTQPGLSDITNTGETSQTSFSAAAVLDGQTAYARIYTKVGDVWYPPKDISFSGAHSATFTAPSLNGAVVSVTQPIAWTSVPNAHAYYLYVGTTPGANNLINTGEIQQTSYSAANIPVNQLVYARIYTRVANAWHYHEITFTEVGPATFTAPTNGATGVNLTQPITWTTVANAQAYYLYVGSAVGLHDIVNTGEILQTSYSAAQIPANQTVYARIYTKLSGAWYFQDVSFAGALAPSCAGFSVPPFSVGLPPAGGGGFLTVTASAGCQWTAVPSASWINVSPTSGTGNGQIQYSVGVNTTGADRMSAIVIGNVPIPFYQSSTTPCPVANANDASSAIQACLDQGGVVELLGDGVVYNIKQTLHLTVPGTVLRGHPPFSVLGSPAVKLSPWLQADLSINGRILEAVVVNNVTLQDINFDGNKEVRHGIPCSRDPSSGNLLMIGDHFLFNRVSSVNARCVSGAEVQGSAFEIRNSTFVNNGFPAVDDGNYSSFPSGMDFSDGLTVLGCSDGGYIHDNVFADNTDVDLITGGNVQGLSTGCTIAHNHISHQAQYGFAGLAVSWFGTTITPADHHNFQYFDNVVTSDFNKLGFGIVAGIHPWGRQPIGTAFLLPDVSDAGQVGSTTQPNTSTGAVINLAIEGIQGGTVLGNSYSGNQGQRGFACGDTHAYTAGHYTGATIQGGAESLVWDTPAQTGPGQTHCQQP
jgi:hypothetical protein